MSHNSFEKQSVSSRSHVFTCVLVLLFCAAMGVGMTAFEEKAYAIGNGWELDVGIGYGSWCVKYNPGFAVMLNGGYRFTDWFSLNLEQTYLGLNYESDDDHKYHFGLHVMETVLTTKFIWLNDAKNLELYLKIGAGLVVIDFQDVFWSLPTGIGMNYYFNDTLGIGLDVQYNWTFLTGTFKSVIHLAIRF